MADAIISIEALGQLIGSSEAIGWYDALNTAAATYNINTTKRVAAWLGQLMAESGKFQLLEESLNYSAKRLIEVFPSRFTATLAKQYAQKPQAIANRVYSNRMGNGDEASGDGWKYRGRGLIQLTGKNNYAAASQAVGHDFVNDPNALLETGWATLSAAWFWSTHGCNELADKADYIGITKAINGGTNGLDTRITLTKQAIKVLSAVA
ncbi:MAG: glycoside hydrolase family 19 protein [Pseudomonadota bacterium]